MEFLENGSIQDHEISHAYRGQEASQTCQKWRQQLIPVGCKVLLNTTEKCGKRVRNAEKGCRKWCKIRQKIVLTTNSKPWVGFPNPLLFWLPWQWGWVKRYCSPWNAESFLTKRRAFRLVPPYGGLLGELFNWPQKCFHPFVRSGYDDKYCSRSLAWRRQVNENNNRYSYLKHFIVWNESVTQGHHHNGDQAARRPHILCSICIYWFGALVKAVRFSRQAKFRARKCSNQTCSVGIYVDHQPSGCNLKWRLFDPPVWGLRGCGVGDKPIR